MTNTVDHLVGLAERRVRRLNIWWMVLWNLHVWFVNMSLVAAIVVPFGLAALLYTPAEHSRNLNLTLIVMSSVALILQVVDHAARFPERCRRLRSIHHRLELGIARVKDERITPDEFDTLLSELTHAHINEEQG